MPLPTLQVLLMGPPQIQREERPVEVNERKAMALLAYLALSPTVRGRDELAVFLWPEHPKARDRLRHALWAAKKAIGQDHLIIQREIIGLRLDETVSVDVLEFRWLLTAYQTHGHGAQEVCDRCLESLGAVVELRGELVGRAERAGPSVRAIQNEDFAPYLKVDTTRRASVAFDKNVDAALQVAFQDIGEVGARTLRVGTFACRCKAAEPRYLGRSGCACQYKLAWRFCQPIGLVFSEGYASALPESLYQGTVRFSADLDRSDWLTLPMDFPLCSYLRHLRL